MIDAGTVKRLADGLFVDPPVPRKIEAIVRRVADQSKEIGARIVMRLDHDYPIATCRTAREMRVLFDEAIKMGYLSGNTDETSVTVKGWQWLTEKPNATSSMAFIAMSFDDKLRPVKEAISKAIGAAGYEPIRVDEEEYVGGVMDKIVALIRESRFVVADFTGNRGGVYYEAGFALGLGITVIQVCTHSQLDSTDLRVRLHFDVNHLNFLHWKEGELQDFSTRLKDRILAVLGRGPLVAATD
jgi:nucleoside 2-deoxyribosyltransferase